VKNTVDVHLKQAAFFATDIFTKPTEVNLSLAPRIVAENEATGELDVVEPSTYVKEEAAPQEVQAAPSKPTKQYTIVVCSCVPRANAEKLIQSLSEQGVEAEIFVKQDILRVVVGTFASRSEAEQALKTMHEGHQAFKDAWILKK
jgi:cell division septation protein DedD